jgi:transcriptional regulator with XRE-family HTH domain
MVEDVTAKHEPDELDKYVGSRVRLQRLLKGKSQEWLGEQINVTFQQVQKYERGANRVSASKLIKIARALGISTSQLLPDDAFAADPRNVVVDEFIQSLEGVQLMSAWIKLPIGTVRRSLLSHIRSLAEEGGA